MRYGYQKEMTEEERYLRDENERLRREAEEEYDRQHEAREQRRREMREEIEAQNRTADTWPEALRKQIYLFEREANQAGEFDTDNFFADGALACRRGLEIWKEVAAIEKVKIDELRRQIKAIEEGICTEVSKRLADEANNRQGWLSIAGSIDNEDPSDFLNW